MYVCCVFREGEVTKEMLNGEATSNASNSPSSNKPRREAARSDMGGAMSKQKGMSPIHLASMCGNVGITEMLAQRGVDVNRPDAKGVTPLSIAAKMGHLSVVEVRMVPSYTNANSSLAGTPKVWSCWR